MELPPPPKEIIEPIKQTDIYLGGGGGGGIKNTGIDYNMEFNNPNLEFMPKDARAEK